MKILVVDDHATNRKLLRVQLEAEGHTVVEAADGVDALASLEHDSVHAVISDILMPRLDGFRLCRAVRQSERFGALPLILYTSTYDSPSDRQLAVSVGADGYIIKPAPTSVLLECLDAALQRNGGGNDLRTTVREEADVLRQYSEALVHKLEEKNSELQKALEELRRAHDEILELNRGLEQRVEERTAEAYAANRAKGTFLATMSHEIRTPMNGMLGMLELLSFTALDQEQRENLDVVRESSASLLRIVDDILDFSKIEAGQMEIQPEPVALVRVLQEVVRMFTAAAASKKLQLRVRADPAIAPGHVADSLRLRQIIGNFVSNSIKFTPEGSVDVAVESGGRTGGVEQVRFIVRDTGIGISAANQQRLFQPFVQGDTEAARRAGGTGLGLTICRRLAEMMNGTVEMQSEHGRGTTMVLSLPLPISDAAPSCPPADQLRTTLPNAVLRRRLPERARARREGLLVLVVDDHPINRMLLERQLQTLGYACEVAESGEQALETWKSGRFSAVITDCEMPGMSGYELAVCIRRAEAVESRSRTPVIAFTAHALAGEADKCYAAGMDDCMVKPVDLTQLGSKLQQWLPARPGSGDSAPAAGAFR